jgi:hypothetical protein
VLDRNIKFWEIAEEQWAFGLPEVTGSRLIIKRPTTIIVEPGKIL